MPITFVTAVCNNKNIDLNNCRSCGSKCELLRGLLSFLQLILLCVGLAVRCDAPTHIPFSVGEQVLLDPLLVDLAALEVFLGGHCFLGLLAVFVGVD